MTELRATLDLATPALLAIDEAASARHPAPGKWSPREVIGHLIDSASHNHRRFVQAAFQDDLIFPTYQQDDWVRAQKYQDAPWAELVSLWAGFNHHLARVMGAVPDDLRRQARARHNLHEILWLPIRDDEPMTLDLIMSDYVAHLQHHLRQILGSGWRDQRGDHAAQIGTAGSAPARLESARLTFEKPAMADADAIFERYSSDSEVTRFMGWPTHRGVADARTFLEFTDAEWQRWPAGAYLIRSRRDGSLLGSTGFAFETPVRAMTGYVLARDAWGRGYATESLRAMIDVARKAGVKRLYAICHPSHRASWHVLEKCGFEREGLLRRHTDFPNLAPGEPADVSLLFDDVTV